MNEQPPLPPVAPTVKEIDSGRNTFFWIIGIAAIILFGTPIVFGLWMVGGSMINAQIAAKTPTYEFEKYTHSLPKAVLSWQESGDTYSTNLLLLSTDNAGVSTEQRIMLDNSSILETSISKDKNVYLFPLDKSYEYNGYGYVLGYADGREKKVVQLPTPEIEKGAVPAGVDYRSYSLNNDGSKVAFKRTQSGRDGAEDTATFWIMNSDGTNPHQLFDRIFSFSVSALDIAWSADNNVVFISGSITSNEGSLNGKTMSVFAMVNSTTEKIVENQSPSLDGVSGTTFLSPNESKVYLIPDYLSGSQDISVVDLATGVKSSAPSGLAVSALYGNWSPDGQKIAYFRQDDALSRNFYIYDFKTNEAKLIEVPENIKLNSTSFLWIDNERVVFESEYSVDRKNPIMLPYGDNTNRITKRYNNLYDVNDGKIYQLSYYRDDTSWLAVIK